MKNILNYLQTAGWLMLPPSVMAYDKQIHGIVAVFITIVTFMLSMAVNIPLSYIVLISFSINTLIAWGYEFTQKYHWFGVTGNYDPKDALVMMAVNLILLVLLAWRVSSIGTASWI